MASDRRNLDGSYVNPGITVFKAVPQLPVINEVVALLNKMGAKIHQNASTDFTGSGG